MQRPIAFFRLLLLLLLSSLCVAFTAPAFAVGSVPPSTPDSTPSVPDNGLGAEGYMEPVSIYDCANYGSIQNANIEKANPGTFTPHSPKYKPDDGNYIVLVKECLQGTIVSGVVTMLQQVSDYMKGTVTVMVALAVAFFGIKIFGGEEELTGKTISMLFRLGIVLMFSYNLGGYAKLIYGVMDDLNNIVVPGNWGQTGIMQTVSGWGNQGTVYNGSQPANENLWNRMDWFLNQIVGFSENATADDKEPESAPCDGEEPKLNVSNGLLGIIGMALYSGGAMPYLCITGLIMLADVVFFVFRILLLYLDIIMTISFLIIISPIIVPLALFFYKEQTVKKWLDMMIAALLTMPMMLILLCITLMPCQTMVQNIINIIWTAPAGQSPCNTVPDFHGDWQKDNPLFNWTMQQDPTTATNEKAANDAANAANPNDNIPKPSGTRSVMPSFMNPNLYMATSNEFKISGVTFGPDTARIMQQLVYAFFTLFLYLSLLKSMFDKIPDIAQNLAGAASGLSLGRAAPMEAEVKGKLQSAQGKQPLGGGPGK